MNVLSCFFCIMVLSLSLNDGFAAKKTDPEPPSSSSKTSSTPLTSDELSSQMSGMQISPEFPHVNKTRTESLEQAVKKNNLGDVKFYVAKGANPFIKGSERSALAQAILDIHFDCLVALLKDSVPFNHAERTKEITHNLNTSRRIYHFHGMTPYALALIYYGTNDLTLQQFWLDVALNKAAREGSVDLMQTLLILKANPNGVIGTNTPLIRATYPYNSNALVRTLLHFGANINTTTYTTALIEASRRGHDDIVEYLMWQKADLAPTDAKGQTALDIANQLKHQKVVKLLTATDHMYDS
jgi:ankyrin repeat protein